MLIKFVGDAKSLSRLFTGRVRINFFNEHWLNSKGIRHEDIETTRIV